MREGRKIYHELKERYARERLEKYEERRKKSMKKEKYEMNMKRLLNMEKLMNIWKGKGGEERRKI